MENKEPEVITASETAIDSNIVLAIGGLLTQLSEGQKEAAKLQAEAAISKEKEITERVRLRTALDEREAGMQYGNDRIFQIGILVVFMSGIIFAILHADSDTLNRVFSYFGAFLGGLGVGRFSANKSEKKAGNE